MLLRTAKKYDSQALEADGLHFSTDVWSSSVVIGGLVCVWLSNELGIPWLAKADAVAALMVAVIVIWVSLQLGKRTVDGLLDTAPDGLTDRIEGAVAGLAGVEHVDDRTRAEVWAGDIRRRHHLSRAQPAAGRGARCCLVSRGGRAQRRV